MFHSRVPALGVLIVAALTALAGCVPREAILESFDARMAEFQPDTLCAADVVVTFVDMREGMEDRPLRIPRISFPGQRDEVTPPLTEDLQALVREEVDRLVRPGSESFTAEVRLFEGRKTFDSSMRGERETARWALALTLTGEDGASSGAGEVELSTTSIDVSSYSTGALFRRALVYATTFGFSEAAGAVPRGGCTGSDVEGG